MREPSWRSTILPASNSPIELRNHTAREECRSSWFLRDGWNSLVNSSATNQQHPRVDSARNSLLFGTGRDIATFVDIYFTGDTALARFKLMGCSFGEGPVPDASTTGIMLQKSSSEVRYATAACNCWNSWHKFCYTNTWNVCNYHVKFIHFVGEEFVCVNRGGMGCSSVFISLSEETAELVLRWKANGMQVHCTVSVTALLHLSMWYLTQNLKIHRGFIGIAPKHNKGLRVWQGYSTMG